MNADALSPEFSQWLVTQAQAGARPEQLIAPLLQAGWDEDAASTAVDAVLRRFVAEQGQRQGLPPAVPVPTPFQLNGPSQIHIDGQAIHVLGSSLHEAHQSRTSDGTYLPTACTPLVACIEQRIADLVGWPLEQAEPLQVLHYGPGAEYLPHYDYFDPDGPGAEAALRHGGQRVATLVTYLNTPLSGGATTFPDAGLEFAAVQGNAVFFSYDRAHPSSRTLHAGAPVVAGEKWVLTRWFRERRFG